MSGFSKKAAEQSPISGQSGGGSDVTQEQKNEWNEYLWSCFNAKVTATKTGEAKEKVLLGKVNLIVDLGTPPAADSKWQTKCALPQEGEEYSQEELSWKKANPTHDFIWDNEYNENTKKMEKVRKQTSPSFPAQEYGIAVDFPSIMVDYSKSPYKNLDKVAPLRISLNGSFHGKYPKTITFDGSYKQVSDKNLVYKICKAAGREQELIDSKFDIATAAGAVCNWKVVMKKNEKDGAVYVNSVASTPTVVDDIEIPDHPVYTAEQQVAKLLATEGLCEFTGILLDGMEYTDDMLSMVKGDPYGYIKRASQSKKFLIEGVSKKTGNQYSFEKGVNFDETDFAKAWIKFGGNVPSGENNNGGAGESNTPPASKPVENKVNSAPTYNEPPMDFDDEIPF